MKNIKLTKEKTVDAKNRIGIPAVFIHDFFEKGTENRAFYVILDLKNDQIVLKPVR